MKKHLLLASAAVLALGLASPAFAQSYNTAQTPPAFATTQGNYSVIDQVNTSGIDLNKAVVDQARDTSVSAPQNESKIYQNGSGNRVGSDTSPLDIGVRQSGSSTNLSKIDQGAGGTSPLAVANNTAHVTQGGATNINKSVLTQQSNTNTASVTQANNTTNSTGSGGNTSTSFISQNGGTGNATVEQGGSGATNYSDILQSGSGAIATVEQGGSSMNTSFITQGGSGNESYVSQSGIGATNYSEIDQTGASSEAHVTQTSSAATTNDSFVTQGGSGSGYISVNQH